MAEPQMPDPIVQWIQQQSWGIHHLEWHVTRLWDARPDMQAFAQQQGWSRAPIQEGAPGNGLEFLAMHRVMIRQLIETFPQNVGLFRGWQTPPTDPNDPVDPVPAASPLQGAFSDAMSAGIARIMNSIQSFGADDDLGLYVETDRRPTPADAQAVSSDSTTGVHNYLHERFSDQNSPIDMGNPQVNLLNQRFWRLHGWIDAQWSRFRQIKGLSESDPAYQAALQDAEHHMAMHMMPMMAALSLSRPAAAPIELPAGLRTQFFSWGGTKVAAAAAAPAPPTWEGTPGQNDGVKQLFTPTDVAHMKSDIVRDMVGQIYELDDYDDVKRNAVKIYGMVKSKLMPPNRPWSDDMLLKFKAWMDAGFPKP